MSFRSSSISRRSSSEVRFLSPAMSRSVAQVHKFEYSPAVPKGYSSAFGGLANGGSTFPFICSIVCRRGIRLLPEDSAARLVGPWASSAWYILSRRPLSSPDVPLFSNRAVPQAAHSVVQLSGGIPLARRLRIRVSELQHSPDSKAEPVFLQFPIINYPIVPRRTVLRGRLHAIRF